MVNCQVNPHGLQHRSTREVGPRSYLVCRLQPCTEGRGMVQLIIILLSVAIQAGCSTEEDRKREQERDRTALPMTVEEVAALPSIDQAHHWLEAARRIGDRRLEQNRHLVNALDLSPYFLNRPDSFEFEARAFDLRNGAMKGIELDLNVLDKAEVALDGVPGETSQVRDYIEQALNLLKTAHGEFAVSLDLIEQARDAMGAGNSAIAIRVRPEAAARAEAGRLAYSKALDAINQARRGLDRQ